MEIQPGKEYWFWSQECARPHSLIVTEVFPDYFEFSYLGKEYCCTYKYADGKIFDFYTDAFPFPYGIDEETGFDYETLYEYIRYR